EKRVKEAGGEGLSFTLKMRGIPQPYEPVGIWLIDQWRQIGVTVKQEIVEAASYYSTLRNGDFAAAMDFQCGFIVEPDLDLPRFLSDSDANYGKSSDKALDDLYGKQAQAVAPEQRKRYLTAFVKPPLDEEADS